MANGANENTGSVKWVGQPGLTCDEALQYTVTGQDDEGNAVTYGEGPEADAPPTTLLTEGAVISGIPEKELDRFLLNRGFEPADDVANSVKEQLKAHAAVRVNGSELDEFEIQQLRAKEAARAAEGGAELSQEKIQEIEEQYNPEAADPAQQQLAAQQEQRQEQRRQQRTQRGQQNVQEQRAEDARSAENGEEGEGA